MPNCRWTSWGSTRGAARSRTSEARLPAARRRAGSRRRCAAARLATPAAPGSSVRIGRPTCRGRCRRRRRARRPCRWRCAHAAATRSDWPVRPSPRTPHGSCGSSRWPVSRTSRQRPMSHARLRAEVGGSFGGAVGDAQLDHRARPFVDRRLRTRRVVAMEDHLKVRCHPSRPRLHGKGHRNRQVLDEAPERLEALQDPVTQRHGPVEHRRVAAPARLASGRPRSP